jgi:hypothetical protein
MQDICFRLDLTICIGTLAERDFKRFADLRMDEQAIAVLGDDFHVAKYKILRVYCWVSYQFQQAHNIVIPIAFLALTVKIHMKLSHGITPFRS